MEKLQNLTHCYWLRKGPNYWFVWRWRLAWEPAQQRSFLRLMTREPSGLHHWSIWKCTHRYNCELMKSTGRLPQPFWDERCQNTMRGRITTEPRLSMTPSARRKGNGYIGDPAPDQNSFRLQIFKLFSNAFVQIGKCICINCKMCLFDSGKARWSTPRSKQL